MNWCDVSLRAIDWIEDGRDIVLHFLVPPADTAVTLTCRWVHGLQTTLAFPEKTAGYPLSWEGSVRSREDGTWDVSFDFASTGGLSLVCQQVEVHRE